MQLNFNKLEELYGESENSAKRYNELHETFKTKYQKEDGEFFSSPGRVEIIGNHTDHNGGKVLASSITMDTVAYARPNETELVNISSSGYEDITIDLNNLESYKEKSGTIALVAGLLDKTRLLGYKVSGFDATMSSTVLEGSGVSSSASFAMVIMSIINYFFNEEKISIEEYAVAGKYAENEYWHKASGMLDQMACAVGGPISLDFKDETNPKYEKLDFSFDEIGYQLFIINTGESHANLNAEYSSIPNEMYSVAHKLGVNRLIESDLDTLLSNLDKIDNDRAVLRAIHFYNENKRIEKAKEAIDNKDYKALIKVIGESGKSSYELLQNCFVASAPKEQKLALALALSNMFIEKVKSGVCRVHGGGFKGTILCLIKKEYKDEYIEFMSRYFNKENIFPMKIRKEGAIHI